MTEWGLYRKTLLAKARRIRSFSDFPPQATENSPSLVSVRMLDGYGFQSPVDGFFVKTPEWEVRGKWGDWLVLDAEGSCYVITARVFAKTYEKVALNPSEADWVPFPDYTLLRTGEPAGQRTKTRVRHKTRTSQR